MIPVDEYLSYIRRGMIPPGPPEGTSEGGEIGCSPLEHMSYFDSRSFCRTRGMWSIVEMNWTAELAKWISGRTVLEVMAGGGWISKALNLHGVNILATDKMDGWEKEHYNMQHVYNVEKMDAIAAIEHYGERDLLLLSWPPFHNRITVEICKAWGRERPVIYIGEGNGGVTAPAEFFESFSLIEDHPKIPLYSWPGLHDSVMIGHWRKD